MAKLATTQETPNKHNSASPQLLSLVVLRFVLKVVYHVTCIVIVVFTALLPLVCSIMLLLCWLCWLYVYRCCHHGFYHTVAVNVGECVIAVLFKSLCVLPLLCLPHRCCYYDLYIMSGLLIISCALSSSVLPPALATCRVLFQSLHNNTRELATYCGLLRQRWNRKKQHLLLLLSLLSWLLLIIMTTIIMILLLLLLLLLLLCLMLRYRYPARDHRHGRPHASHAPQDAGWGGPQGLPQTSTHSITYSIV